MKLPFFLSFIGFLTLPGLAAELKSYDSGSPTHQEQLMLELINRARANPAKEAARLGIGLNDGLAPGTITTEAKPPLAPHPALFAAARNHSRWMLEEDVFSHTGKNGSSPGDRMTAAGFVFSGSTSWGENIAWGGTSGTPQLTRETIARHEGLFRSAGHRTNICGTGNNRIGLGILSGEFDGWNAVMATQTFARSGAYPENLVTGVIFKDKDGDGFYDPGEGIPGIVVTPADGGWRTVSSASGGYAVPYTGTTGAMEIVLSGDLPDGTSKAVVKRTSGNVKLDLLFPDIPAVEFPEIAVRQPAGKDLKDGKALKNFGTAAKGTNGKSLTFTIANRGKADLTRLRVTTAGVHPKDFVITSPGKATLAPGASTTFKITFRPKGTGEREAILRIRSNDADESPFDIRLAGAGRR